MPGEVLPSEAAGCPSGCPGPPSLRACAPSSAGGTGSRCEVRGPEIWAGKLGLYFVTWVIGDSQKKERLSALFSKVTSVAGLMAE